MELCWVVHTYMIEEKYSIKNIINITLFKEGIEYIVHSHSFTNDRSLGTTQQPKRVVNASRNLALMSMQFKEENNPKH